jgi:hypothetical protein
MRKTEDVRVKLLESINQDRFFHAFHQQFLATMNAEKTKQLSQEVRDTVNVKLLYKVHGWKINIAGAVTTQAILSCDKLHEKYKAKQKAATNSNKVNHASRKNKKRIPKATGESIHRKFV